jgi:hypothetical protein
MRMANEKPPRIKAMPNDVGEWGEKRDRGNADYQRPFVVAGEVVDLDALPRFGPGPGDDEPADAELADGR